jgi:hypothetical protein
LSGFEKAAETILSDADFPLARKSGHTSIDSPFGSTLEALGLCVIILAAFDFG